MPLVPALRKRWERLSAALGIADETVVFERLVAAYSEQHRHYHTLDHVQACLSIMDWHFRKGNETADDEVELALWFHDIVYDPHAADNERRSADALRECLIPSTMTEGRIARICRLIEATDHRFSPTDDRERLIVDIDLSILGACEERYDAYSHNVRREYGHIGDAAYAAGRADVLRSFLDRVHIYTGNDFIRRYEGKARHNLVRELLRLQSLSGSHGTI